MSDDAARSGRRALGYIPELDGLRAGAIVLVLLAHSVPHGFGGLLGVDVFFVLSGFLITALLITEDQQRGGVNIRQFYVRRAFRLLPALAVMLFLVLLLTVVDDAVPTDAVAFLCVIAYAGNWLLAASYGGATSVQIGYLSHTWSLAIEEQFYLVWPWLVRRWLAVPRLAARLAGAAAVLAMVRTVVQQVGGRPYDWITPLRADGLLLGAALAVLVYRDGARQQVAPLTSSGTAWMAVGALGVAVLTISADGASSGAVRSVGSAVAAAAAIVMIGHVLTAEDSSFRRILRIRPLVLLGRVSYGVYLFHYPILTWTMSRFPSRPIALLTGYALTSAVTTASWAVIERPTLRLKDRLARRVQPPHEPADVD